MTHHSLFVAAPGNPDARAAESRKLLVMLGDGRNEQTSYPILLLKELPVVRFAWHAEL